MNEWKRVLLLAKRDLVVLMVSVVVGMTAVFGLKALADNLQRGVERKQSALQEQQQQLSAKQSDLSNMREHIKSFELLRQQGFFGDPDRALWVEQLQSTHIALGLPGDLVVTLQSAKPLGVGDGAASGVPASVPAPIGDTLQTAPLVHELQFELSDSLETEVLRLIHNYREQVKGRFRVNACKWFDPKDTGLKAQCVLRFVSIPLAEPASPPPQVAP